MQQMVQLMQNEVAFLSRTVQHLERRQDLVERILQQQHTPLHPQQHPQQERHVDEDREPHDDEPQLDRRLLDGALALRCRRVAG